MVYRDKSDKFHLKFQTLLAVAIDPLGSEHLLTERGLSLARPPWPSPASSRASTPTRAVCRTTTALLGLRLLLVVCDAALRQLLGVSLLPEHPSDRSAVGRAPPGAAARKQETAMPNWLAAGCASQQVTHRRALITATWPAASPVHFARRPSRPVLATGGVEPSSSGLPIYSPVGE